MLNQNLLQAFSSRRAELEEQAANIHRYTLALLHDAGIAVHTVSYRVKNSVSLSQKLARPDRIYRDLSDITDLIGIRIVTYFEDSIDKVAALLEDQFVIDRQRSIDKRDSQDPSRFGYRSLHYICQLEGDRGFTLTLPFEIQIRTILQHAWAEIEHDLGYKYPEAIPHPIRRRFSRLAGLLEIADAEFVELRRAMEVYAQEVLVKTNPSHSPDVSWDVLSLESLVSEPLVGKLDTMLAGHLGINVSSHIFYPDYLIRMLNYAELNDRQLTLTALASLEPQLREVTAVYFQFTQDVWGFSGQDFENLPKAYCLFILAHWQVLRKKTGEDERRHEVTQFYQQLDYPSNSDEASRVAARFIEFFSRLSV